jgi:hypothetical protein
MKPSQIEALVANMQPTTKGEEGLLYLVEGNYVKKWRGGHFNNFTYNVFTVIHSDDTPGSPQSPYKHAREFYQAKLVQLAFPNVTLDVVCAYDPRIQGPIDQVRTFDPLAGRPTTITPEVVAHPELGRARDQIMKKFYDRFLGEIWQPNGHGRMEGRNIGLHRKTVALAEQEIEDILGNFGVVFISAGPSTIRNVNKMLKEKRTAFELISYGILPVHPEFNFIPTAESHPTYGPQGVFIEVELVDEKRYFQMIGKRKDVDQRRVTELMKAYCMYKKLDNEYIDFFVDHKYKTGEEGDITQTPESMKKETNSFEKRRIAYTKKEHIQDPQQTDTIDGKTIMYYSEQE